MKPLMDKVGLALHKYRCELKLLAAVQLASSSLSVQTFQL